MRRTVPEPPGDRAYDQVLEGLGGLVAKAILGKPAVSTWAHPIGSVARPSTHPTALSLP